MENILRQHQKQYPLAQPQDMIKLLFQSEFGCGHFIAEEKEVTSRIKKERQSLSVIDDILPEPIGNGFYRLPLSAPLADETLASIFFLSAKKNGTFQGLKEKLQYLKTTIPVLYDETAARQALNGEIPRHSEIYRKAYRPAYRIITEEFARFIRIYYRIDALSGRKNIAIDGQEAAGKGNDGQVRSEDRGVGDTQCRGRRHRVVQVRLHNQAGYGQAGTGNQGRQHPRDADVPDDSVVRCRAFLEQGGQTLSRGHMGGAREQTKERQQRCCYAQESYY